MNGHLLARAESGIVALVQRIAFVGVMGMVIIGLLTVLDVIVLRAVFRSPIPGSNEFLTTIFAVAIAAVLPSGLSQRGILEVDLLSNRLGKNASAWLRTVGSALFFNEEDGCGI